MQSHISLFPIVLQNSPPWDQLSSSSSKTSKQITTIISGHISLVDHQFHFKSEESIDHPDNMKILSHPGHGSGDQRLLDFRFLKAFCHLIMCSNGITIILGTKCNPHCKLEDPVSILTNCSSWGLGIDWPSVRPLRVVEEYYSITF